MRDPNWGDRWLKLRSTGRSNRLDQLGAEWALAAQPEAPRFGDVVALVLKNTKFKRTITGPANLWLMVGEPHDPLWGRVLARLPKSQINETNIISSLRFLENALRDPSAFEWTYWHRIFHALIYSEFERDRIAELAINAFPYCINKAQFIHNSLLILHEQTEYGGVISGIISDWIVSAEYDDRKWLNILSRYVKQAEFDTAVVNCAMNIIYHGDISTNNWFVIWHTLIKINDTSWNRDFLYELGIPKISDPPTISVSYLQFLTTMLNADYVPQHLLWRVEDAIHQATKMRIRARMLAGLEEAFERASGRRAASGQTRWIDSVRQIITNLNTEYFSISDVYSHIDGLADTYPNNNHIKPKIRQQLQILRDSGLLEFLGKGRYRLMELDSPRPNVR
jgi:hypothetical protein